MIYSSPKSSLYRLLFILLAGYNGCAYSSERPLHMPHDRYNTLTLTGDICSLALPIIGILEHLHPSTIGSSDSQKMLISTIGVLEGTHCIKRLFKDHPLGQRPNGYHSSFPSAHAANAFYGARMIHKSFGLSYGAPAYAVATITAYSRVQGHYHHTHDVVAGALFALAVDHLVDNLFETEWIHPLVSLQSDRAQIGLALKYEF